MNAIIYSQSLIFRIFIFTLMSPIVLLIFPFAIAWGLIQLYKLRTHTLNPDYFTTNKEL